MQKSTVSQTEDLQSLLRILNGEIQTYLKPFASRNVALPSLKCLPDLDSSAPYVTAGEVTEPRRNIIHICEKITALLQGPGTWLTLEACGHLTSSAISIALKLRLPHLISSDANAPTSLDELAKITAASPELLMRILRHLTQRFIFEEIAPLYYVQNAMSKALTDPVTDAWIGLTTTDFHRASCELLEFFTEKNFQMPLDEKSAFSKAFKTNYSLYDYYSLVNPERGRYYAASQRIRTTGPHTLYPYAHLPPGSRVVDVGGGSGHITVTLARQYPGIRFIIQDSADTIAYGQSVHGSEGLSIEWQQIDFFSEQPMKGAEVYLLRHVLIDHPDGITLKILNCIANAMDEKSRLLIADVVVPDRYGEDSDSLVNALDLYLLSLFNSKERSVEQLAGLLGSVERPLEIVKVWRPDPLGAFDSVTEEALLEVKLKK
ncbi:O-methyltransferase-domain-containing protein [Biscogniauxia marginata]|nr:O-methyltransferase-domain-containing protein [Biscogniauxia marginata]